MKIPSTIEALWERVISLREGQVLQLTCPSQEVARRLLRDLKKARKVSEELGFLDVPLRFVLEPVSDTWVIQVFKERPVKVDLIEVSEDGDATIKESFTLGTHGGDL